MNQFVSSLQFVASSSTDCSESVRQFVTPYIETGSNTNTQRKVGKPKYRFSSSHVWITRLLLDGLSEGGQQ